MNPDYSTSGGTRAPRAFLFYPVLSSKLDNDDDNRILIASISSSEPLNQLNTSLLNVLQNAGRASPKQDATPDFLRMQLIEDTASGKTFTTFNFSYNPHLVDSDKRGFNTNETYSYPGNVLVELGIRNPDDLIITQEMLATMRQTVLAEYDRQFQANREVREIYAAGVADGTLQPGNATYENLLDKRNALRPQDIGPVTLEVFDRASWLAAGKPGTPLELQWYPTNTLDRVNRMMPPLEPSSQAAAPEVAAEDEKKSPMAAGKRNQAAWESCFHGGNSPDHIDHPANYPTGEIHPWVKDALKITGGAIGDNPVGRALAEGDFKGGAHEVIAYLLGFVPPAIRAQSKVQPQPDTDAQQGSAYTRPGSSDQNDSDTVADEDAPSRDDRGPPRLKPIVRVVFLALGAVTGIGALLLAKSGKERDHDTSRYAASGVSGSTALGSFFPSLHRCSTMS